MRFAPRPTCLGGRVTYTTTSPWVCGKQFWEEEGGREGCLFRFMQALSITAERDVLGPLDWKLDSDA